MVDERQRWVPASPRRNGWYDAAMKRGWNLGWVSMIIAVGCSSSPSPGRDAGGATDAPSLCATDEECADGVFCNGDERCMPRNPGANADGCAPAATARCMPTEECVEATMRCVAPCESGADADADGSASIECGGDDCNDTDAEVRPGRDELCNNVDDDCDLAVDEEPAAASGCPAISGTTFMCRAGRCEVASCAPGLDDCDESAANGCEQDLTLDRTNCGECRRTCGVACFESECDGYTSIASGTEHSCGVLRSGRVACWGTNTHGQLGDGSFDNRDSPDFVLGISEAVAVDVSAFHSCAVNRSGTVACWGSNVHGVLGDGGTAHGSTCIAPEFGFVPYDCSATPVEASGLSTAVDVTTSMFVTCARLSSGSVMCWGAAQYLGDGLTHSACPPEVVSRGRVPCSLVPSPVATISNAISIDSGNLHACVVTAEGSARCWGGTTYGALGDGSVILTAPTPVAATGVTDAVRIVCGSDHTCVERAGGTASCWGSNAAGQLRDGTTIDRPTPVATSLPPDATGLVSGSFHSCAIVADGRVNCWGGNAASELGDGIMTHRLCIFGDCSLEPVEVSGLADVAQLSGGCGHRYSQCAILASGEALCWGDNTKGQLGDGTRTSRSTPVSVLPLP